jgi:hypothetical protein
MKPRTLIAVLGLLLCASEAQAQIKVSGTIKCGKAEVTHQVEVEAGHVVVLEQSKCTPAKDKAITIDGVKEVSGVATAISDVQGNKASFRGYYVHKLENGDTATYRDQGNGTVKDGVMQSAENSWSLVSGTGKLKGAKGKGTCKATGAPDGSVTWECSGELTLVGK